jgi:hypothetical protein
VKPSSVTVAKGGKIASEIHALTLVTLVSLTQIFGSGVVAEDEGDFTAGGVAAGAEQEAAQQQQQQGEGGSSGGECLPPCVVQTCSSGM